jgi:pyruvate dehydrogenase E2 component (dihydrolipoamide acetyltransferase)
MAEIVRMPKMSDTMTEGVVSKWHKKIGDTVKTGDLVAEIETDKATMEFESYQEGTLLYIGVQEGKSVPVNGVLAVLGKKGEEYQSLLDKEAKQEPVAEKKNEPAKTDQGNSRPVEKAAPAKAQASVENKPVSTAPANVSGGSEGRQKASPLAKKLAGDKGIDLSRVMGSGDGGRIVKRDIDWFKPSQMLGSASTVLEERYSETPVSQMRKTIAKRLAESKFTSPHFYLSMDVSMEASMKARESINAVASSKISFNDIVVKASAAALRENPKVNSSWLGDVIRTNEHIHIGVAVAVEEGLLVPVIRFADSKTLSQIGAETKDLAAKAKSKKLQPADWEGNTFTISNLGMFGISEFTAIINPPDACILAVGAIRAVPVVKEGQVVPGHVMTLTLSCDHRVVDGATGAQFLQTLKFLLENPVILLGAANI